MGSGKIGPMGYAMVMLVLFGYFGWLMSRMAAFSPHGFLRLGEVGFGLLAGVGALAVGAAFTAFAKHRASRGH